MRVKLWFNAFSIWHHKAWYRLISHGFVHADYVHLGFNMMSLYFFGPTVERLFKGQFGDLRGVFMYFILYVGGLICSSIYSLIKYRDHPHYNALGASGAVCGIIFSYILFFPNTTLYVWTIPVKAWLYGILFLTGSWYMSKQHYDTIGHDAHFFGALWGLLFTLMVFPKTVLIFKSLFA